MEPWDTHNTDLMVDFLEVAIHAVLHARNVYPQDIFERRRKYGVPVWMSRHPHLNEYICKVLMRTSNLMALGVVRKVVICLLEYGQKQEHSLVERFVFEVGVRSDQGHSVEGGKPSGRHGQHFPSAQQEFEDQLRSALLQIEKSSAYLPTRQGSMFSLQIEVHEPDGDEETHQVTSDGAGALREALSSGDWLLTENEAHTRRGEAARRVLIPIKSVQNGDVTLDLSVEMGQSLRDCCP